MSSYRPNVRNDGTPNTPSTASSCVRQNPLNYQRMHSNDSDKEKDSGRASDWLDATPSNNSNGASKPNSSPTQKQKWITATLPSGGRINKPIQLSQNKNDTIDNERSQSSDVFDGNTEHVKKNNDANLMEGVSEKNQNTDPNERSVTFSKIFGQNRSEESSIGSTTSLNNVINSDPNPSGSSGHLNQDDSKSSSTTSSAQYSINDNSENSEPKRTLLNKYVKKVKNLMKKWWLLICHLKSYNEFAD